jgi:hypothetical protein
MQADQEYTAGVQYTLRDIPRQLDEALRQRAKEEGKSLNQVTIEALLRSFGWLGAPVRQRDLSAVAGSWQEDPDFDSALEDQDRIDPETWK